MIRVLQVLPTLCRGGLETFVMNVYRSIDTNLIQFDFLTYNDKGDYKIEILQRGGTVFCIPAKSQNPFAYKRNLDRFFKEHANIYTAVHLHDSVLSSIDPLKYAKKYGIRVRILHSHSSSVSGNKIHYILHYIMKPVVHIWATHYYGCSDKANKWFYKYTGVYSKVRFIPNGIDTAQYVVNPSVRAEVRNELGISQESIVIGHVGRIMWIKNHKFLIEIFQHYHDFNPDSLLIIVGIGPLETEIKKLVKEKGLEKSVIFTGVRTDVNRILQAFDIFVMPSFYEGLPLVLVEAQAAGLPVICSDTISDDSILTNNYIKMSLDEESEKWCKKIMNVLTSFKRTNTQSDIIERGFDIKQTSKFLESVYIQGIER